jgi:hypothetical protein
LAAKFMAASEIIITVQGETEEVPARGFVEAISGSLEALSELDSAISHKRAGTVRWMIGALKYESPAMVTLRAVPLSEEVDVSAEIAQTYLGGLKVLQEGKRLPDIFSETALNAVKRLARIGDGVKAIKIQHKREIVRITERLAVNLDELVSRTFDSIGSVEGKLEMVTIHSQRYFRVYEPVHGRGVVCYFAPELLETVKESLGRRVVVSGTLRSDRFGRPDSITVTDFRTVVEEDALPKPSELRGLVKGMTAGEKAEDYLRKLRGD